MATVLGREAFAGCLISQDERDRGAVFTPTFLAEWVASLLSEVCHSETPMIADLGCGSGNLLSAASTQFASGELVGVEIDSPSARIAGDLLGRSTRIIVDDVLTPRSSGGMPLASYWIERLGRQPDALIMNPPWGADHTVGRGDALSRGLTLARGQFDTYDLFCELALQVLRPGGAYAFIIPDSIFLPEHEQLRRLLVTRTSVSLIARLGEGIFPGVYRGCAIVLGCVNPPQAGHRVECIRLTKSDRRSLQHGRTLADCRSKVAHFVPQARFIEAPSCEFDIDVSVTDATIARVLDLGGGWTLPLHSRRGVELSKFGRVVFCSSCGTARPKPKDDAACCLQCAGTLSGTTHTIISERPTKEGTWRPFIAGEDVRRYAAESRRWIRTGIPGINYKASHDSQVPRILIRKTGVGLNAALDSSAAFTNQVVFEYTVADQAFDFSYLHYALGVLCSRVLLAVHLKRGGDLEWRSHPYVTQKTLAQLPIPLPRPRTREWHQAAAIAGAVEAHISGQESDLHIEALVGGLYGLSVDDMRWVAEVLSSAGNLEGITNMRLPVDQVIQPITVQ